MRKTRLLVNSLLPSGWEALIYVLLLSQYFGKNEKLWEVVSEKKNTRKETNIRDFLFNIVSQAM
jgi:hypothetical protein